MNDILGRELKDGDLCIGMAIGRNSHGMHIGIFKGSSVCYLSHSEKSVNKSCTSNTYLIENPTEKELEIKNKVQKLLNEEENERKRKASAKTIPLGKLEVGGVYTTTQGVTYMYLGKRKVTFEDLYRNTKKEEEGNCFIYVSRYASNDKSINDLLDIYTYAGTHNVHILKGNKKLTKMIKKVDLTFPLIKEKGNESSRYYSYEKYRLTVN